MPASKRAFMQACSHSLSKHFIASMTCICMGADWPLLTKFVIAPSTNILSCTNYAQLFGNVEDQEKVTRMFQIIVSLREKLLTIPHNQGLLGLDNSGPI